MMTSLWAFLLTLGILIVIHEWGHYRAAVACGVKVLRFSIGFGPVLWRKQRGETEFVLAALPLGGYVRMLDEREGPVESTELDRAFNRKPLWQRSWIVFAGPLANLLLAIVLYAITFASGVQEVDPVLGTPLESTPAFQAGLRAGDKVVAVSSDNQAWQPIDSLDELNWQISKAIIDHRSLYLQTQALNRTTQRAVLLKLESLFNAPIDKDLIRRVGIVEPYREAVLGTISKGGPADLVGLKEGDRIIAVNQQPIADAAALRSLIRNSIQAGQPVNMLWQVQRGPHEFNVVIHPIIETVGNQPIAKVLAVIGGDVKTHLVSEDFFGSTYKAVVKTGEIAFLNIKVLGQLLIGQASFKNLGGTFSIADMAGQAVQLGVIVFLGFIASMSATLGALNLLPIPALDGGHLMYHLFEWVTGRPLSELWLERLQRGGLTLLLLMMLLAHYNDVVRFWGSR